MKDFYYIYVLKSEVDNKYYTGYTSNLKLRLEQHNKGQVESTKSRRPLKLIYFEGCLNQQDATKREKYLKTHYGKMFLGNRLKSYLTGQGSKTKENGVTQLYHIISGLQWRNSEFGERIRNNMGFIYNTIY